MKYKTKLDPSILIGHKKRTGDVQVVSTSIGTCEDHVIPKSNMKDYDRPSSYEKTLIHEHDFSVIVEKRKCIIRCLTCSTYFCEICGKVLDDALIHTDRLCFEMHKQKRAIQTTRKLKQK
jgi:hypothetical protein